MMIVRKTRLSKKARVLAAAILVSLAMGAAADGGFSHAEPQKNEARASLISIGAKVSAAAPSVRVPAAVCKLVRRGLLPSFKGCK